jgi:pre-mRNA-splicing helicase BRR2
MLTLAAADNQPNRFLHLPSDDADLMAALDRFVDKTLKETVASGVAYLHEGTAASDTRLVEQLFSSGAIQVCGLS